ncbi:MULTISPECIES: DUF6552 family protein [unclassified Sulfitobacter]|uniref:DUF6552 family protein n=1 Tax=unclassified Sulfitobacter TaxID=196795 RepID=UPI0023E2A0DB|nr:MULTISPECIES: DUF6552 family protein [unclassified Sulfitobacter]MDF3382201.1 ubiquinone biosynthesis methyltransferase UbiE [Sulfitobacter sp. Ks11]MDF3385620.1 ubiquinone biosynthesis methyltransferase UbiE [Sulfitobacter sp. M85]MDF3389039.1 ubiquinone biosynthesis methyltransferase UbiE [Sulfitobacter sp. Ks16]MDF3399676.1 ubiquinone biosynthesis methyltransferase UbiE [Sulfitobacter sp. KE39]MDF3403097.1 ubiquinone biosynthesis methyltransferase UbiE [Sulfitobacter sp. Ks35]
MASEVLAPATPQRLAFWVKWIASVIQILGYAATGFGWTPWNLYLFVVGVLGWLIVGLLSNDRAITLVHLVAMGAMLAGMASQ